jgi:hypothetical protein
MAVKTGEGTVTFADAKRTLHEEGIRPGSKGALPKGRKGQRGWVWMFAH